MHQFSKATFKFLTELRANNTRDWILANKDSYETEVRQPFLDLIAGLAPGLKKIDPSILADPSPTGGSMMRIHRDIRFSKDKSPYKTFVAAHFGRGKGMDEGSPGFYLRIEPDASLAGGGLWQPDNGALGQIRHKIANDPDAWRRVTTGRELGRMCTLAGESLKRPPAGYDANHPLIEDIKRKDFAVSSSLTETEVCDPGFKDLLLERYRSIAPFLRFLSEAIGSP